MVKKILKDCLPTIFSLMMISLYGVVDGLFIGNMVGDIGLAAVNIAWPIPAFISATGVGIGIGGSVLIGYNRGQGKEKEGYEIFCVTFTLLLIAAICLMGGLYISYPELLKLFGASGEVYMQASYYAKIIIIGAVCQVFSTGLVPVLRNYGMPMEAMYSMVTGTILNIIINYILMFRFGMGMKGAALGTLISQGLVAIFALYILGKKLEIYPRIKLKKDMIRDILKVGVTGFGISLAPSITLIFTNLQCLRYGGDSAVACYAVIAYIVFPMQALITGIGEGTQPLTSFYYGAKKYDLVRDVKRISYGFVCVLSIFITAVILVSLPYLGDLFGLSKGGQMYFQRGMACYALSFVLVGLVKYILCYLNATMQTTKATILTYLESIAVAPVLLYFVPLIAGIEGIWLTYPLTAIIILIPAFYHVEHVSKAHHAIAEEAL